MPDSADGLRSIQRVDFGYFVRPGNETLSGKPHVEACLGYLIDTRDGHLLVDTGLGSEPETDAYYRSHAIGVDEALAKTGSSTREVRWVINCHLHFDHCGGNPLFAGRPIFTQREELDMARNHDNYTLPELIDSPGLTYEVLDGETEVLPGIIVIPTPGHTVGHQSVAVRAPDGTVIVAGQSNDSTTDFSRCAAALRATRNGDADDLEFPSWVGRLLDLDPARIVFAHDHSVWQP